MCAQQLPAPPRLRPHNCQVTESLKGAEAGQGVDPYPSLCGATLATWYKVCLEQLQVGAGGRAGGRGEAACVCGACPGLPGTLRWALETELQRS